MASVVDSIWNNGAAGNPWNIAWLGSVAYTLEIFFDFSGYSDMAIGLGRMFGFHFNENFNLPYISKSITEFWRRWHISLSSWFRDYVYIPLGGNRKGHLRTYINLSIVFLLTGIWHGASYHFILWGIWNGFFILVERFIRNRREQKEGGGECRNSKFKNFVSLVYTLFVVNLGWVLFRAPSTHDAVKYAGTMFGLIRPTSYFTIFWYLDKWTLVILIIGIFCATKLPSKIAAAVSGRIPQKVCVCLKYILLLCLLYLAMIRIVSGTYNPFIYFQF